MDSKGDGNTLKTPKEEQLQKFIAHMNIYSQHKRVMAEIIRPEKEIKTNKNRGYENK